MQGSVLRLGLEIRLVLWDFFEWLFSDCLTFLILANNGVSFSFFYHWWLFCLLIRVQFSSIRTLSCVHLFGTPWTAAHKTSLSITNSQSLLRLMSIQSVMPSNISTSVVPFSSTIYYINIYIIIYKLIFETQHDFYHNSWLIIGAE